MTGSMYNVFTAITALHGDLNFFNSEPRTIDRRNQNRTASLNFIKYLHKKAFCKELLSIIPLQMYEMNILTMIATDKIFLDDTWRNQFSNAIGEIQRIIISKTEIESEDYKKLLKEFPIIRKYTPPTEPTYT